MAFLQSISVKHPLKYEDALAAIGRARNGYATLTANVRLYLVAKTKEILVQLHDTYVAVLRKDGSIQFRVGGYHTRQSAMWMQEVLDTNGRCGYVFLDKGVLSYQWGSPERKTVPIDGMQIDARGHVTPSKAKPNNRLAHSIKTYCREFTRRFLAGEIHTPGPGDCILCMLAQNPGREGDAVTQGNHLRMHLAQGYFVPGLFHNAASAAAKDHGPASGLMQMYSSWRMGDVPPAQRYPRHTEEQAAKSVYLCLFEYISEKLGCIVRAEHNLGSHCWKLFPPSHPIWIKHEPKAKKGVHRD